MKYNYYGFASVCCSPTVSGGTTWATDSTALSDDEDSSFFFGKM